MNNTQVVAVLNHLLAIHHRSLPSYLKSANPWTRQKNDPRLPALLGIADDHERMVGRIGEMIIELDGAVRYGEIPMRYADWHDLSIDFLLQRAIESEKLDIERIQRCIEWLEDAPRARALAEESLGEAKAHLEILEELAAGKVRPLAIHQPEPEHAAGHH